MSYLNSTREWINASAGLASTSSPELALASKALVDLSGIDLTLICLDGELWLTRDRDPEDHIVESGQRFTIRRSDKAVVHALRKSRIRLVRATNANNAQGRAPCFMACAIHVLARLRGLAT
ncbi:MAG: DUF2917 domain-containing protein [Sterolibacterium sp.]